MPWVNPKNDRDLTSREFDAFVENHDDPDDLLSDRVWLPAHMLFDHSNEEIEAMDERDKANGDYIGSSFVFGRN